MGTDNQPYPTSFEDLLRRTEKRMSREERKPSQPDIYEVIGPGIAATSIEIKDWNDEVATYNGFFYSDADAVHAPDEESEWIGQVFARDDGSGVQMAWDVADTTPRLFVRTWEPLGEDTPSFSEWQTWQDAIGGGGGAAPNWEDDDSHAVTAPEIAAGTVVMDLSHRPRDESVQIAVGGLVQPPTQYTVDYPLGQVTFPLSTFEPASMVLKAQYEWTEEITYSTIPWAIMGTNTIERNHASGSALTSFALPGAAAAADILVYMQLGGFGTDAVYGVTDSRLYTIGTATVFGRTCGLYVGYVGAGLAPITMNLLGGSNAYGQFAHGTAMVLRSGTSRQLQFRTARSGVGAVVTTNSGSTIPNLTGNGSGALACAFNVGGLGGGYGVGWGSVGQGYSEQYEYGDYEVNSVAITTNPTPTGANYPTVGTGGDQTCVMVVGVQ